MSPRARHADRDTTDPVGFPPVPDAAVPHPRRPDHGGGWAGSADPAARSHPVDGPGAGPPDERVWLEPGRPRPGAHRDPDPGPGRVGTGGDVPGAGRDGTGRGLTGSGRDGTRHDLTGPGASGPDDWDTPAPEVAERWPGAAPRRRGTGPEELLTTTDAWAVPDLRTDPWAAPARADARSWAGEHEPAHRIDRRRPAAPDGPGARERGGGPSIRAVLVPVVAGSLVAVALGVWARQHEGTGIAVNLAGFSSGAAAKAWLGSLALLLALLQGVTGWTLRRGTAAPMTATVHRWSGRFAVLVTVPVAVQCLYAFGWSGATTSALLHSALGCVFYGAFVTKMLLLRRPGVPGWVLALAGGVLLAVLAGVWLTSALWFFTGHGPAL